MTATRFAGSPAADVKVISEQAQVDAIVTGTILSDGEHLRVTTQLVQAPVWGRLQSAEGFSPTLPNE
jgi:TolB-like protein